MLINVLGGHIPVCELAGSYRSGDQILKLARAVRNEGKFEVENSESTVLLEEGPIEEVAGQLKSAGYRIEEVLFVSPTRYIEKTSAELVVPALRKVWNPGGERILGTNLYVGDPVICIENDYADLKERQSIRHPERNIDIYNGYRGVITRQGKETVWVRYEIRGEQKEVPYTLYEIPYWLEQAYCITVHKSQGGGWPVVVFIGQEGIDRQLLYTGITRAKDKLILIGKREWWEEGVKTKTPPPLSKFGFRVLRELEKAEEQRAGDTRRVLTWE
ncbi:MAG: ATP-binding domain-containing protein [Syntrophothermus sp.]|uniref:ATP-dependent DNA helicase n=1 Tax=Syntrophothermus sp. TaxID=2736299 RepID=UPI00257C9193|nr:ATP-dependent RecD-like DNA helicase [Syntrophothermus sp.]NSW83632.1 ATP-binding domain-containing protein [Syntrophothermus sp.]